VLGVLEGTKVSLPAIIKYVMFVPAFLQKSVMKFCFKETRVSDVGKQDPLAILPVITQ
jgi:hypothetical protein